MVKKLVMLLIVIDVVAGGSYKLLQMSIIIHLILRKRKEIRYDRHKCRKYPQS
jgi:hypothetical protein